MSSKKHDVPEARLAGLLADYQAAEDLVGENGLLKPLPTLQAEKALDAAMAVSATVSISGWPVTPPIPETQ